MDLVQVDVIDAEPTQTVLDGGVHPPARIAPAVQRIRGIGVAQLVVELGGQDHLVARPQCFADDLLVLPEAVHVGRVDEVDPTVGGLPDDAMAGIAIAVAPHAEHHGAKTEAPDAEAGTPEWAHRHRHRRPCHWEAITRRWPG